MNIKKKKIIAILLMAGEGTRFKDSVPKQFHKLSGKKIYQHTLDIFLKIPRIDKIILVCHKKNLQEVKEEALHPKIMVIEGGLTRQESSYRGLLACGKDTNLVIIHDAVRPFVSERIILENIRLAEKGGAVDTCIETFDTIIKTEDQLSLTSIPKRSSLMRGQTPQTFRYETILKAHEMAQEEKVANSPDDCSLVLNMGQKVFIVKGEENNLKITTKLDLFIAEQLFRTRALESFSALQSLHNKKYIVVGGTGGIGKELLVLLKREQALPIPLSTSTPIKLDLQKEESIREAFSQVEKEHGRVDGLINCAGILSNAPLEKLTCKEIDEQINVNFRGLVLSCKAVKIRPDGQIINISSSSYFKGRKNLSIYSSCKAAVINFSQAIAEEYPLMKINSVVPQRTKTPMREKNFPEDKKNELLSPKKVAKVIVDLLKNTNITGSIIEVKK